MGTRIFFGSPFKGLIVLVFFGLLWSQAVGKPSGSKPKAATKSRTLDYVFTNESVLRIKIDIPKDGMAILRKYQWGWGGGGERQAVRATVREGETVYTNVAVHLKGAAGSFRRIDENPCLTLKFDKFVDGQRFHGLDKISLNNSVQDPSYLSEKISREMFEKAGVPVPRAGHATVELNGRALGLYVLTEGFDKQFLKRYFKNAKGNLYDGGFLKEVTDELEKSSGANPKDRSDLKSLAEAASEPDPSKRLGRLEKVLDLDRFITYLAMDVMTCNWDGYAINKNNYRLYHDPDSGRFVFFPHGLDQMFGVMRADPTMPLFPRMEGMVAKAVIQTPAGRQRYLERISQLMTNVFKVEALTNRVNHLAATIRPVIAERNSQAAKSHDREVAALEERIVQRAESLQQQLAAPSKALKFDSSGIARIDGWQSKTIFGKPTFAESAESAGKKLLSVNANQGSSVGWWRTKVMLEGGHYRFEGRVKTQGVVLDPGDRRGGVGVRTGNGRLVQKLTGDSDWANLAFEFDVQDGMSDVELVCELRAAKGEAWFDASSLKLTSKR